VGDGSQEVAFVRQELPDAIGEPIERASDDAQDVAVGCGRTRGEVAFAHARRHLFQRTHPPPDRACPKPGNRERNPESEQDDLWQSRDTPRWEWTEAHLSGRPRCVGHHKKPCGAPLGARARPWPRRLEPHPVAQRAFDGLCQFPTLVSGSGRHLLGNARGVAAEEFDRGALGGGFEKGTCQQGDEQRGRQNPQSGAYVPSQHGQLVS
jgi:hypothetical protein